jgi:hypothetical protein
LDGVGGYSQGAQIGSPSRSRWRDKGQVEPICRFLGQPAIAAAAASQPK